jgi:hypothetical protein
MSSALAKRLAKLEEILALQLDANTPRHVVWVPEGSTLEEEAAKLIAEGKATEHDKFTGVAWMTKEMRDAGMGRDISFPSRYASFSLEFTAHRLMPCRAAERTEAALFRRRFPTRRLESFERMRQAVDQSDPLLARHFFSCLLVAPFF